MAALELAAKLAILEQAMKRLETELQHDRNWRALRGSAPDPSIPPEIAEARTRHLLQALEGNPIYCAWRDMQGVASLLRGEPSLSGPPAGSLPPDAGEPPSAPVAGEPPAPKDDLAAHYEMSQDVADLVRTELEQAGREAGAARPSSGKGGKRGRRPKKVAGLSQRLAEMSASSAEETHSVPLAAEDFAFLISPSTAPPRPAAAPRAPQSGRFFERIAGDGHIPRALTPDAVPEAEVTVVRRRKTDAASPAPGTGQGIAPSGRDAPGRPRDDRNGR
ncbi:MAG: hypothetical protein NW223_05825 [Hyphomicrobiaceae bacterium]|nr:hypothetical protein [Hyphomicrobiaceae bacterium]